MPDVLTSVSTSHDCSAERKPEKKSSLLSFRNICHLCFFLIITIKLYGEYFKNVVLAFWVCISVIFMGSQTQRSFSDSSYRKICFLYSLISLSHVILVQYSLWHQGLYDILLAQTSSSFSSLSLVLWCALICDCSMKLLLVFIKSTAMFFLSRTVDCYTMGSFLSMLEHIFLLLRHIPSGILWIYFLMEFNWKYQGVLAGRIFVCCLYCILKICVVFYACKDTLQFFRSTLHAKPYTIESNTPSNEVCYMCLELYTIVGVLPCGHKFCAKCTSRWCNAFTSCPCCSSQELQTNSKWRDGSMDLFIQFY
uniref:RING-type domain-containing protein n=1 Tax=Trichobilharzia regenti TaxID=157069 RepID=A0AA85K5H6_TRIRE|nr:unnamed protein product [Trichobilharzia regenti]